MTIPPTDVGVQTSISHLYSGGACWGSICHHRKGGPNAGPDIDHDTLGLCQECRADIMGDR